jgi:hypothetical protein
MEKECVSDDNKLKCALIFSVTSNNEIIVEHIMNKGDQEAISSFASIYTGIKNYSLLKPALSSLMKELNPEENAFFISCMSNLKNGSEPVLCPLENNAVIKNEK